MNTTHGNRSNWLRTLLYLGAVVALTLFAVGAAACGGGGDDDDDNGSNDNGESNGNSLAPEEGTGISVAEAVGLGGSTEPVAVNAFIVDYDGNVRMCDELAKTFPPLCGGRLFLTLNGVDISAWPGVRSEGVVTWTPEIVQLTGTIERDVFTMVEE